MSETAPATPTHDELWSLLDWTLWGAGMADVFREPLADKMCAAITPEERSLALALIERWHSLRGEPVVQRQFETMKAEITRLRRALAGHLFDGESLFTRKATFGESALPDHLAEITQLRDLRLTVARLLGISHHPDGLEPDRIEAALRAALDDTKENHG